MIDGVRDEALRTIPGIRRLTIKEMGADVMASSAAPVQVIFHGPDLERLHEIGEQARRLAEDIPGLRQVATSWARPCHSFMSWPTGRGRRSWAWPSATSPTRPTTRSRAASPPSSTGWTTGGSSRSSSATGRTSAATSATSSRCGSSARRRGRAAHLGRPPRGAARPDAHRARQLPARVSVLGFYRKGACRAWSCPWTCSTPRAPRSTCLPATG